MTTRAQGCCLALFLAACSGAAVERGGPEAPADRLPGNVSACPAALRRALPAGQHGGLVSAGQVRSFTLLLPPASFTAARPLLVVFHGTGLSGRAVVDDYGLADWAARGFIVAAPDANGNGAVWPVWDGLYLPGAAPAPNPDEAFFDDLLACVAAHHAVDARRVFVAGHSAGGGMANHLLGVRAAILAGGISASGVFDLTQPAVAPAPSPLTVIVTWGGANDVYSGAAGGLFVEGVGFAEQAALASQHWESTPLVHQVACAGHEVGHRWLRGLNGWFAELLLASPKGDAPAPLPPAPPGADGTCGEAAASYAPPFQVTCGASTVAGCQGWCQRLADCLAENGTLGTRAAPALGALGFTATADPCAGCLATCEADAVGSAADAAVLACLEASRAACGPGFQGTAAVEALDACCAGVTGSRVCGRACAAFTPVVPFGALLPACP
jgi:poly(3-hydroxybutyrate) depolymerase